MAARPDHSNMVSLRGKEYAFELKGQMPDGRNEVYRQLYMDTFLLFALPINPQILGDCRVAAVQMSFNSFVRDRLQKLSSEFISMRMDKTLWQYIFAKYLPQGQLAPAFPWELPQNNPASAPSAMYKAWRRKMGISYGYKVLSDSTSTDAMLAKVSAASTREKVRGFLKEQQQWQWYTTRATMPKRPPQQPLQFGKPAESSKPSVKLCSCAPHRCSGRCKRRSRSPVRPPQRSSRRSRSPQRREESATFRPHVQSRDRNPPGSAATNYELSGNPQDAPSSTPMHRPGIKRPLVHTVVFNSPQRSFDVGPKPGTYALSFEGLSDKPKTGFITNDPELEDIYTTGNAMITEADLSQVRVELTVITSRLSKLDPKRLLSKSSTFLECEKVYLEGNALNEEPDIDMDEPVPVRSMPGQKVASCVRNASRPSTSQPRC
ncbi:unnamed protein product [Clonostachys rosea]|uniref:Uncharacterized protein n=1 Tax=Bionectria ochroleuca TaxID=29856 RepID=A0ABY6U277_BIOOC|nr:unnamed protein product [Clonostachys rosea]